MFARPLGLLEQNFSRPHSQLRRLRLPSARYAAALTNVRRYLTGSYLFQLILQMFCFHASTTA